MTHYYTNKGQKLGGLRTRSGISAPPTDTLFMLTKGCLCNYKWNCNETPQVIFSFSCMLTVQYSLNLYHGLESIEFWEPASLPNSCDLGHIH